MALILVRIYCAAELTQVYDSESFGRIPVIGEGIHYYVRDRAIEGIVSRIQHYLHSKGRPSRVHIYITKTE